MITPLEMPSSSNPGRFGSDGAARLINCYPEFRGKEGKIPFPMYAPDGWTLFATLSGGGKCRGMLPLGNQLYVVSGRILYRVSTAGVVTVIGGIPGDKPCYMAQNQKSVPQIAIVTDGLRYIVSSGTLTSITDSDLVAPNSVVSLNQRFVYTSLSGRFQWSGLLDGEAYDPLDFATAEYGPDGLLRGIVRRGELLLIGQKTIEPWYATQSGDDIFARSGNVIERGCINGATAAIVEETVIFVADDLTVRALDGYTPVKISNGAVERSIRDTSDRSELVAWSYAKDGHAFYVLQGTDFTWVYDAAVKEWHERKSYGIERWRAQYYANFSDMHIVGDYEFGKLYRLSETAYEENGEHIVMTMRVPVHAFPNAIELNTLFVDAAPGLGLNSSDEHAANPKVMVRVSRDNGKTFGSERSITIGRIGEYLKQAKFNSFGTSKEDGFVIEVSMSAATARAITGLSGDIVQVAR